MASTDKDITFEQIRNRAYELWERNHRPDSLEIQFWLLAERELRAERRRSADVHEPDASSQPMQGGGAARGEVS